MFLYYTMKKHRRCFIVVENGIQILE